MQKNENFSEELQNLRNLAMTITRNPKITVNYNPKASNSSINLKTNDIILTLSIYPEFVQKNDVLASKILDADLGHETGHYIMTKPFTCYYEAFFRKCALDGEVNAKIAHDIMNHIEDKRVNYYIINRYKYDVGKRLKFANIILGDASTHYWKTDGKEKLKDVKDCSVSIVALMFGVLCAKGLYNGDIKPIFDFFGKMKHGKELIEDTEKLLSLLNNSTFQRLRIDLMRTAQDMYCIFKKWLIAKDENNTNKFIHARANGKLIISMTSKEMREKLEEIVKEEEEKQKDAQEKKKLLNDLTKLGCVGESTGTEINAPEPNLTEYYQLVQKNQEYISKLLSELKKTLKPIVNREIFQRRGKMLNGLLGKVYANSLNREVKNVYINNSVNYEKEKVNIAFLFDMSGSVPYYLALDICTTLSEVFGKWLEDYAYSLSVFAKDCFRIKTFFETYENTKGRIGNLRIDRDATYINALLKSYIKQFNTIKEERRKILVVCSDMCLSDESEATELLKIYEKLKVNILFLTFGKVNEDFIKQFPNAKHMYVKDIAELPTAFLQIYLNAQNDAFYVVN